MYFSSVAAKGGGESFRSETAIVVAMCSVLIKRRVSEASTAILTIYSLIV